LICHGSRMAFRIERIQGDNSIQGLRRWRQP
jgi:hypothetical protein